jgi:predicted AlkP superfamily phosphohydrolase/phosphomutase
MTENSSRPQRRVLALAIDGGNPDLMQRWAAVGALPNIASLIRAGVSGSSRGLDHFFVGSTWPSLYTGTSPAEHGHHSLVQLRPRTYESFELADESLVHREPFWDVLSRAGRRVAILDVPLSQPSPSLNGIQTVEWGSHDAVYGFLCSSRALQQEIVARFGLHPLGPTCDQAHRSPEDYEAFISRLIAGTERKAQITRELLRKERWDFCIQVFTESHCVGHQCWHLHDPTHPAHDPRTVALTGDPLERVYRAIDSAIGEVLDAVDDDVTVAVFSAHGMSYWYGAQLLLPEILLNLGAAAPRADAPHRPGALTQLRELAALGWRRLPLAVRQRLAPLREQVMQRKHEPASAVPAGIDAARSRCFPVYNGLIEGGIRLNQSGREPSGVLDPADAERFCAQLRNDLLAITDERTGGPLIRDLVRTKDVVDGARLDSLPDLLVLWSDAVATGSRVVGNGAAATIRAHSPRIGTVEGTNAFGRTGEHRPDGFCVFAGPDIEPGRLPEDWSIYDYAPTFTAMLGVTMPGVRGRALDAIVGKRATQ